MRGAIYVTGLGALLAAGACAQGALDDVSPLDAAPIEGDAGPPIVDAAVDTAWPGIDSAAPSEASTGDDGDGAMADDGALADVETNDAGCDAATPAHIPASGTSDTFASPVDARWAAIGSADIAITQPGWALLTPDSGNKVGGLWWNATYVFDHFDVTFSFQIDNKSGGADGLAFGWVPGALDTTKLGGGGNGYGFSGLGGFAVAIDTYQNSGDPAVPFLAVIDSTAAPLTKQTIPNVRDGFPHGMRVVLQNGAVTVWIDGTLYVSAFAISGYTPFAGHWGFTASTGGSSERHFVTGIAMTFPDGQGCPAAGP